jgi:hypothetical protein
VDYSANRRKFRLKAGLVDFVGSLGYREAVRPGRRDQYFEGFADVWGNAFDHSGSAPSLKSTANTSASFAILAIVPCRHHLRPLVYDRRETRRPVFHHQHRWQIIRVRDVPIQGVSEGDFHGGGLAVHATCGFGAGPQVAYIFISYPSQQRDVTRALATDIENVLAADQCGWIKQDYAPAIASARRLRRRSMLRRPSSWCGPLAPSPPTGSMPKPPARLLDASW